MDKTFNLKPISRNEFKFPVISNLSSAKFGILKANKQEMSGSIAQSEEQSAVNRFVVGSSPSVPVLVLTQQIQYRFKVVVAGSSPALLEMAISSVGRARKMRTVKETKNLCSRLNSNIASWLFWVQFLNVFAVTGDRV